LVLALVVGCAETGEKTQAKPEAKPAAAKPCEQPKITAKQEPIRAQPAAKQTTEQAKAPAAHTNVQQTPPAVQKAAETTPAPTPTGDKSMTAAKAHPTPGSPEAARAQYEDVIYATIRVKMEEMVAERARLLKTGRPANDWEVQQLERSILRARQLLVENGEIVGEIEPPITQTLPPQPKK
jgi:hypothetical protein